jgi:hypothetical protein
MMRVNVPVHSAYRRCASAQRVQKESTGTSKPLQIYVAGFPQPSHRVIDSARGSVGAAPSHRSTGSDTKYSASFRAEGHQ